MRLLRCSDTSEFSLTQFRDEAIPPYAILSHTWGVGTEVTFEDLTSGTGRDKPGYEKIRFCREQAALDGLEYFWIDTCCINRSDAAELSQAINSMFRWYRNAARCYVYLSDVSTTSDTPWVSQFRESVWFTQGWTLQDLLAPSSVEFFSRECKRLGDRSSLGQQIHEITGIPMLALRGAPLYQFSVNERLSWIERRQTTVEEDKAYALLGVLDVYMPTIYGQGGASAFERLLDEINKSEKCMQELRVTDPRDDKKRTEDTKGGLIEDSYRWILENPNFQQWRDDPQSRLLWVKGGPGKGKTILFCGIINELEKSMPNTALLSYFFCQATDPRINNATAILRGLIYLLVSQQPSLISHIRNKHDHAGKALFNDANAWVALSEIFTNILRDPSLNIAYLIVDALDECIVGLPKLLDFVKKSCVSSRVKWLVSSRSDNNIERRLQLDDSGATLSLDDEDDDTDIKSFIDSGYGTTSETSSVYFIANAPGAREDILALLLQDEELQILFNSAFDKVSAPKFEHSFRTMLGQFARELRNEARDRRERSVAYVVRTIAGYVSNCICKRYGMGTDMRAQAMDQLSSQLPQKRQLLERLLNPTLTDTEDLYHEGTSPEDQVHEAEEDDWDENDMVSLPHLEQLEKFVINSEAMSNLRRNLRNWINPQHQRSHPLEQDQVTAKEFLEMQEPDEQKQSIVYQVSDTRDQDQPLWWRLKKRLKRFARPSVPIGYRRLEWTCDCGEEMYGDYDNQDPVAVEKLASILQRRACVTQIIEKESIKPGFNREQDIPGYKHASDNSRGEISSSAHYSGPSSSRGIEQSGSTQASASNQSSPTGTKDSSSSMQSSFEASSRTASHQMAGKRMFLELCVNTGEIDINLGEIDITDVNSDGELFKRIYERYKDLRGHRMRRIFLKPVDVHFVHFSVQGRYRVGIYGQPLVIPPEDEVKAGRYHYEECPLKVQPPMDYRTFLHYMNTHKHRDPANPAGITLHTDSIFLRRLPKKTGTSILTSQQSALQFGWGVHIIEGPNKVVLSWTTFLSLALSFVVSALYSHFWHTQEQGFGIGQWMVAVLSAAIAALYFQWAET